MFSIQKDYNEFFKELNDMIRKDSKPAYTKRKYVKSGKYSKKPIVKTLRDEFAMAALTGLCANYHATGSMPNMSEDAYKLARLMLAERNRTKDTK